MRTSNIFFWLLALAATIHAFALPRSLETFSEASQSLFKRKGGGGGGGGGRSGGSGGSGPSSSGSGSGSSSSGSGSRGGSSSGTGATGAGRGTSGSNAGGQTTTGSGAPRAFGGSYAGGAAVPYSAGSASYGSRITPYLLGGAALGFFPGLWLYGAYAYPYGHPWSYHNNTSNQNMTLPVTCLCQMYNECGCDDNNSTDYQNAVANNGSVAKVVNINGTQTLAINGTLPNGTTADGGSEDPYDSAASSRYGKAIELSGFWVVIGGVLCSLYI